ncbi:hypothetical protein LCGC14_1561760 [marine sediment metagenome]|uniref:Uncharacterized protein n=1 Tax=marine sediment metagenome TaxID=412755 RepID=A0A0F9LN01_9ZZZZ
MQYVCVAKCYFGGKLYMLGDILHWSDETSKPPNHFEPVEKVIQEKKEKVEETKSKIDTLRDELGKLGKPFDKRWGESKLKHQLVLAKKGM